MTQSAGRKDRRPEDSRADQPMVGPMLVVSSSLQSGRESVPFGHHEFASKLEDSNWHSMAFATNIHSCNVCQLGRSFPDIEQLPMFRSQCSLERR